MLDPRHKGLFGYHYRHIKRYRRIFSVLLKYGIGHELYDGRVRLGLGDVFRRRRRQVRQLTRPERLRMALEELGPTFIKLGQLISARRDLISDDYQRELARLQDEVPPFPVEQVHEIIREETGADISAVFAEFNDEPLAAASIAQVHRAVLKNGDVVAVKVQRPGIRELIEVDLDIILQITLLNEKALKSMGMSQPASVVEEFSRRLQNELDFVLEAVNIERFAHYFRHDNMIYVPKVYRDISTRRLLVMEYTEGIKATELDRLISEGYDCREIAKRGATLILKQIFVHGFFHADPHPGNIVIMPDNVVCYLDFGAMGRISEDEQEEFASLIMNIARRDARKAASALLSFTVYEEEPDRELLERDLVEFIDAYTDRPLREIQIRDVFASILDLIKRHSISLKSHHFKILMALSTSDGLGRQLDPDFEIVKNAEPFIRHLYMKRLDPRSVSDDVLVTAKDFIDLLREFPLQTRELLAQARRGNLRIEFHHRGLDPMLATLDQISNRISFTLVLAALIIGSSLITLSDIPPKWNEIPVIGVAGFLVAGIMGFWLLAIILKHRRM